MWHSYWKLVWMAFALFAANLALAQQDYPTKSIRIFTSEPGGGTDFLSRIIAQGISAPLGQPVIVENRPANIAIVGNTVAKSAPDGYALLVWANSLWLAQFVQKVPFDAPHDFAPIMLGVVQPSILAVHPLLPVKSTKDLIALAKARPGQLNYAAAAGAGGPTRLNAELFKSLAQVDIFLINYKSTGAGLTAIVAGETQVMFPTANSATTHMKSGRLKALAVTTAQPSPLLPGLPTIASVLPGYEAVSMTGVFAPAKTPQAIVNRLHQEIQRVLTRPDIKERFFNAGSEVVASTPEQMANTIRGDMVRWAKVIKDAGIKED